MYHNTDYTNNTHKSWPIPIIFLHTKDFYMQYMFDENIECNCYKLNVPDENILCNYYILNVSDENINCNCYILNVPSQNIV